MTKVGTDSLVREQPDAKTCLSMGGHSPTYRSIPTNTGTNTVWKPPSSILLTLLKVREIMQLSNLLVPIDLWRNERPTCQTRPVHHPNRPIAHKPIQIHPTRFPQRIPIDPPLGLGVVEAVAVVVVTAGGVEFLAAETVDVGRGEGAVQ